LSEEASSAKVLLADDNRTARLIMRSIVRKAGYDVTAVEDGVQALAALQEDTYDILITDWMMPEMDGIELIQRTRAEIKPSPLIMMVTALNSDSARKHSLEAGADEYLAKPVTMEKLQGALARLFLRRSQPMGAIPAVPAASSAATSSALISVGIVAGSGSVQQLQTLLADLSSSPSAPRAAFFVVQHGPAWVVEELAAELQANPDIMPVLMAASGMAVRAGEIYLAPGDHHLSLNSSPLSLQLNQEARVNHVRPAGDVLFGSIANVIRKRGMAVVLGGLGVDGANGAAQVASVGGKAWVIDPAECGSPDMPESLIGLRSGAVSAPLARLASLIGDQIKTTWAWS
jgi:two-component system, chemotaxis family, protein-glutamate methylesterase/glutaminase